MRQGGGGHSAKFWTPSSKSSNGPRDPPPLPSQNGRLAAPAYYSILYTSIVLYWRCQSDRCCSRRRAANSIDQSADTCTTHGCVFVARSINSQCITQLILYKVFQGQSKASESLEHSLAPLLLLVGATTSCLACSNYLAFGCRNMRNRLYAV